MSTIGLGGELRQTIGERTNGPIGVHFFGCVVLLLTGLLVGCDNGRTADGNGTTAAQTPDERLEAERRAWYAPQAAMDCVLPPYDEKALEAVRRAYSRDPRQKKYGPPNLSGRPSSELANLKTRTNPHGEGIIVTAWIDHNLSGFADYSRRRSAWLVLGGVVYPLNVDAAADIGVLMDGVPPSVQKRSGLAYTWVRGKTMMDQLGIEEFSSVRRGDGGNPFPMCR